MTTVINTNIASLIAQNNLANTQNSLNTAITQLSSGLKINSAADDPAGQAIASLLQSQINGLTTAQANANTGISLAQTGESALNQITNNLQTIRQLAVQSSNGTNSAANRASLDQEAQQAIQQINTIASTTQFNGTTLLDGTFGLQNFQIGANAGQTLGLNISAGVKSTQIGQISSSTFQLAGGATGNLSTGTLTINDNGQTTSIGTAVAGTGNGQTADSAFAAATAINNSDIVGLDATASNAQAFSFTNIVNGGGASGADTYSLQLNGATINAAVGSGGTLTSNDLILAINNSTAGVRASDGGNGIIVLTAADGSNINLAQSDTNKNLTGGLAAAAAASTPAGDGNGGATAALAAAAVSSAASGTLYGSVTLSSANTLSLSGTVTTGAAGLAAFTNDARDATTGNLDIVSTGSLAKLSLQTEASSQTAIEIVDSALNQVSTLQGQLGSVQNRFTSTIANLTASTQNASSAQSTIQDANFATATAALSRAQVLSQAATAIIAQANQLPNQVLKLLQ